ncbi:MAG: TRAP transporter large permease [Chloroflexi bacterium]|nr:TRAP transporter large permease [Chloroflexota bacterium]
MDPFLVALLSFVVFLVLVLLGMHVGTALIIVALTGMIIVKGWASAISTLRFVPFSSVVNYNLAVVPMFILMGEFISASGLVVGFFEAAQAWVGRIKGGLGITVAIMGAGLGAVTGSAVAGAAMMTRTAFPEMLKHKYDAAVSSGLIAAVSPLVLIIPPSIFLVFYAIVVEVSVTQVLIAGFLPGFFMAAVYALVIYVMAIRSPHKLPPVQRTYTFKERMTASKGVLPIVITIVALLGGLYAGVFTASEVGGAGAFIAVIALIVFQRGKAWRMGMASVWEAAGMTSMIFYIVIGALLYGRFIAATGATPRIVEAMTTISISPYVTFLLVVILYLILGCFIDGISLMAITLPIVYPLLTSLGFDGIWLGVMVTILVGVGALTPPFGIVVFTVKSIIGPQVELMTIFKNTMPFFFATLVIIVILTVWPEIVMLLPNLAAK